MRVRWAAFSLSGILAILLTVGAFAYGLKATADRRENLCRAQNELRQANRDFLNKDLGRDLGLNANPNFRKVLAKAEKRFHAVSC